MRISLNGESRQSEAKTLGALLAEYDYRSQQVATALNGSFVHRHLRDQTVLKEGDKVEIVAPIEGG